MTFCPDNLLLYAVTDRTWTGTKSLYEQVEEALSGGVTLVQLREKNMEEELFLKEAIQIKRLCHQYGVPLLINDNVKVAADSGADGVHVGAEDKPVKEIRRNMGKDFIIGATAKTVAQAQKAQEDGADYLGVGAVFPSPTKTNAVRITPRDLSLICSSVSIPCVAIGGITLSNLEKLKGCGAKGVAVVSAIFSEDDIKAAATRLKEQAENLFKN